MMMPSTMILTICISMVLKRNRYETAEHTRESIALANMARDDPPASSTAALRAVLQAARPPVKWDRNLKPKLAIMRQCTSVTDRRTGIIA